MPTGIVPAVSADDTTTYTVGELNQLIRQALARRFPDEVWVEGEIRGLKRPASGHRYFELADSSADGRQTDAVIQVALYRSERDAVNRYLTRSGTVRMDDGVHIRIRGSIDYYAPQGRLSLRMTWIDPDHTLGRLEAERRRLLEALRAEALLERNRMLAYPLLPLRVGLVTSAGSAAHEDFVHELTASGLAWKVSLAHASVQGPTAELEITAALRTLATSGVDVIAVVRGGGARTDLAAFDTEAVARTIAAIGVPVLTGIGHETDQVVADLVAARSAKTPTACAALLVADATAARARAERAWSSIATRSGRALDRGHHDLERVATGVAFAGRRHVERRSQVVERTSARLARRAEQAPLAAAAELDRAASAIAAVAGRGLDRADLLTSDHRRRILGAAPRSLRRHESDLAARAARVAAADPARLLARGWSIVRTTDGQIITRVGDLAIGSELVAAFADGTVRAAVTATAPAPPAEDRWIDDGRTDVADRDRRT